MTSSFTPPVRRLMGPGPSDVHPRVLSAMAQPTIGHLDPLLEQGATINAGAALPAMEEALAS